MFDHNAGRAGISKGKVSNIQHRVLPAPMSFVRAMWRCFLRWGPWLRRFLVVSAQLTLIGLQGGHGVLAVLIGSVLSVYQNAL
jgi:hypothetical protein